MKVKKLFKNFNTAMSKCRKVEIYNYDDDGLVFTGMVSDIPNDLKNKTVGEWFNMLNIVPQTLNRCCDEDVTSVNVEMVLAVFVIDKD